MIKSFIDPNKIIGDETKAVSPEKFSNFMTGRNAEAPSSAFAGAANNISNFSRSAVGVKADSNLAPIISNISTNIINNIDNSVSNTLNSFRTQFNTIVGGLQKRVESNLTAAIQNFSKDYQQKISSKEDSSSSKILKDFISVYQTAMDFVASLGDSKNNKRIESSIKGLRSMFDESFNAAVVIRQTIGKIVRQLSNLPTASPSSGGLNLNVQVPGGPLKQQGSLSMGRALKGRGGAMLAAGAVGAAAVGVGAMGMQEAQRKQEEQLAKSAKKESGKSPFDDFIDGMNNIVKSFSDSINRLFGVGQGKGQTGASSSSSSSGPPPSPGPTESPGAPENPDLPGASGPQGSATKSLLDTIAFAEGTFTNDPNKGYDILYGGGKFTDFSKHPDKVITSGGRSSAAAGRYQFMPFTWNTLGGGAFTPERQDAGAIKLIIKRLRDAGINVKDENELESLLQSEGISPRIAAALSPEWASFPTKSGLSYYGQPVKKLKELQNFYNQKKQSQGISGLAAQPQKPQSPSVTPQSQTQSRVQPAPQSTQQAQQIKNVNRSPSEQTPSVAVINAPPQIASIPTGESQTSNGNATQLPSASTSGPDVSMYSQTRNPNDPYWFAPFDFRILNMA